MKIGDTLSKHQFENYSLESDNLDMIEELSRMGVMIHRSIQYQVHGSILASIAAAVYAAAEDDWAHFLNLCDNHSPKVHRKSIIMIIEA